MRQGKKNCMRHSAQRVEGQLVIQCAPEIRTLSILSVSEQHHSFPAPCFHKITLCHGFFFFLCQYLMALVIKPLQCSAGGVSKIISLARYWKCVSNQNTISLQYFRQLRHDLSWSILCTEECKSLRTPRKRKHCTQHVNLLSKAWSSGNSAAANHRFIYYCCYSNSVQIKKKNKCSIVTMALCKEIFILDLQFLSNVGYVFVISWERKLEKDRLVGKLPL